MLSGEYSNPTRVIAFTEERWSEDVSETWLAGVAIYRREMRPPPSKILLNETKPTVACN